MTFFIIFIILSFTTLLNAEASNQLIEALRGQAAQIAKSMPSGYQSLVVAIQTNGLDGYDACDVTGFNSMIAKYGFSSEIVNNFKMVTFSESVEFQSFHVSITNNYADIIEFIGAGSNSNGNIQIAYLQVFAEGTPYPGQTFSQSQIETITEALRATAYTKVEQFLASPPDYLTNYKQREQYLLDQNAWDMIMTSWDQCEIEYESPCDQLLGEAVQHCQQYASSDYDDRDVCVLPYIPLTSYWDACFYCFCSILYYAIDPTLPKSYQKCFEMNYPGVTDIYDSAKTGPNSLNNIHYWNETIN